MTLPQSLRATSFFQIFVVIPFIALIFHPFYISPKSIQPTIKEKKPHTHTLQLRNLFAQISTLIQWNTIESMDRKTRGPKDSHNRHFSPRLELRDFRAFSFQPKRKSKNLFNASASWKCNKAFIPRYTGTEGRGSAFAARAHHSSPEREQVKQANDGKRFLPSPGRTRGKTWQRRRTPYCHYYGAFKFLTMWQFYEDRAGITWHFYPCYFMAKMIFFSFKGKKFFWRYNELSTRWRTRVACGRTIDTQSVRRRSVQLKKLSALSVYYYAREFVGTSTPMQLQSANGVPERLTAGEFSTPSLRRSPVDRQSDVRGSWIDCCSFVQIICLWKMKISWMNCNKNQIFYSEIHELQ